MLDKTARTKWKQYVKHLAENSPADYDRLYNEVIKPNMYKTLPNGKRVNRYIQGLYDRAYNRAKRYGIDIVDFTKPGGPDRENSELLALVPDSFVEDIGYQGGGAASLPAYIGQFAAKNVREPSDRIKRLGLGMNATDRNTRQLGKMTRDVSIVAESRPKYWAHAVGLDDSGYSNKKSPLLSALLLNHEVEENIASKKHRARAMKNPRMVANEFANRAAVHGYTQEELERFANSVSKLPFGVQAQLVNANRGSIATFPGNNRYKLTGSHYSIGVPANDLVLLDHYPIRNDKDLDLFYRLRQSSKEEPMLRSAGGAVGQKEGFNRKNVRNVLKNKRIIPEYVDFASGHPNAFQHLIGNPYDECIFDMAGAPSYYDPAHNHMGSYDVTLPSNMRTKGRTPQVW